MESKKSNKGLYIIIIVLVAVISLLVGFVFGKGLLDNNNDNSSVNENNSNNVNDNSKEEDEIVSVSDVEGYALFEKVKVYNNYFTRNYSTDGLKSVSNNDILLFLLLQSKYSYDYTVDNLKENAKKYLSDDINVTYTDIYFGNSDIQLYKLGQDGKYTSISVGIGGGDSMAMEEFYINGSYNKTKDIYTINTKLLYNQWCSDTCGVGYGPFYSDSALKNEIYSNTWDNYISFDNVYEKVKDKLPITSYTFEKNSSGNYVLTSVVVK